MTVVMLFLGIGCFAAATVEMFKGRALLQIIGAALLALAVFFMLKSLTSYSYIVLPLDGEEAVKEGAAAPKLKPAELAFTVSKRYARGRESYVCQLDMSSLIAVKDIPDTAKKNDVILHFKPCDVYDYTVTVGRKSATLLVFNKHGYNKTAVVCELDNDMLSYFKQVKIMNERDRNEGDY